MRVGHKVPSPILDILGNVTREGQQISLAALPHGIGYTHVHAGGDPGRKQVSAHSALSLWKLLADRIRATSELFLLFLRFSPHFSLSCQTLRTERREREKSLKLEEGGRFKGLRLEMAQEIPREKNESSRRRKKGTQG